MLRPTSPPPGIPIAPTAHVPARRRFRVGNNWLYALDAAAPHAIAFGALLLAYQSFPRLLPGAGFVIAAIVLLAIGSGIALLRDMPLSHRAWPVALVLFAALLPLMALHGQEAQIALQTPVRIHLVPLAFTWGALAVVALLTALTVASSAWNRPDDAVVTLLPLPLACGWLPLLSLRPTEQQWFVAALSVFALSLIVVAVGWLLPERWRWLVVLPALAGNVMMILRDDPPGFRDWQGRWLLLGDVGLVALVLSLAIALPVYWGRRQRRKTIRRTALQGES